MTGARQYLQHVWHLHDHHSLDKLLIGLGIYGFGDNSLGWRIAPPPWVSYRSPFRYGFLRRLHPSVWIFFVVGRSSALSTGGERRVSYGETRSGEHSRRLHVVLLHRLGRSQLQLEHETQDSVALKQVVLQRRTEVLLRCGTEFDKADSLTVFVAGRPPVVFENIAVDYQQI